MLILSQTFHAIEMALQTIKTQRIVAYAHNTHSFYILKKIWIDARHVCYGSFTVNLSPGEFM